MKKILYASIALIEIFGMSAAMNLQQKSAWQQSGSNTATLTPQNLAAKNLAERYVANITKINKSSIADVVNEYYCRSYWRINGTPGKGTEYSIALAKAFLSKMLSDNRIANDQDFKKFILLLRKASGEYITGSLHSSDFDDSKIKSHALNSVGVW